VEVSPQEELQFLSRAQVLEVAEDLGLAPGAWAGQLDFDALALELNLRVPELSWVSLERQGTLIRIKVAERDIYSDAERSAEQGAIIAEKDALLEDVLIKRGRALVRAGDTVTKGTVLVAPDAEGKAEAIIRARVWYKGYGECALNSRTLQPVGETRLVVSLKKLSADGGPYELRLWGRPFAEGFITSESEELRPHLFDLCELPLCFVLTENTPMVMETITLTDEEAKAEALAQAESSLRQQLGASAEILEQSAAPKKKGDLWTVDVVWECREEIGRHAKP